MYFNFTHKTCSEPKLNENFKEIAGSNLDFQVCTKQQYSLTNSLLRDKFNSIVNVNVQQITFGKKRLSQCDFDQ